MITIFTPLYNREKYLDRIYKSLLKQKDKNFEWLIIDDGSTDNPKNTIEKFIKKNKIKIEYIKKENGGKHTAHNLAIKKCKTKYMMCLDSDDELEEDAIQVLNEFSKLLNDNIWAVVGPRVKENGKLNSKWEIPIKNEIKFNDIYQKYYYVGETYILFNMDIVRKYRFPVFEGEKLVPENILYDSLDDKYNIIAIDNKIYISDYQEDGYTKNSTKTFFNSLKGSCYSNLIKSKAKSVNFKGKIIAYARYNAIKNVFGLNDDLFEKHPEIFIRICSLPVYMVLYLRYLLKKVRM